MSQTNITHNASAATTAQNIIRESKGLSIEFRKATGEYFVNEKGAGICTFFYLSNAVKYFNERLNTIEAEEGLREESEEFDIAERHNSF